MKRFLKPWVFILTGVVFNISSAVITHYFIGLNNERIANIDRSINNRQVLIDSLWQSKTEVERKKEFYILYFTNQQNQDSVEFALLNQHYQKYLLETARLYELSDFEAQMSGQESSGIKFLLEFSSAVQASIIKSINNTYFEKLDLVENKMPIEQGNARLFSIAIFLQVIGLILILARDLKRN
jgi:hypothetical protein